MRIRFPNGDLVNFEDVDEFHPSSSASAQIDYYINGTLKTYVCYSDLERVLIETMIAEGLEKGTEYLILPSETPMTITSISPTTGSLAGREFTYVQGTGFRSNCSVKFGSVEAFMIRYLSSTLLAVWTPQNNTAGTVDVIYSDTRGKVTLAAAFTFA